MFLRYAKNQYGECKHVTQARSSEAYYCPCCGCMMRILNLKGELFFDIAPGAAHENKACEADRYRIMDPYITLPEPLINSLLTRNVDKQKKNKSRKKGDPLQPEYDWHYHIVPLRSIADFLKNRMDTWPANTMLNGYELKDLFISRKDSELVMQDNTPLGFRIVEVKFYGLRNHTIRFALHAVTDDGKKVRYFDLFVEDEEEYRILRHEVSSYRNARYFIAGVWESADSEISKNGEWEIVGVQKTTFTSDNQVYKYCR